MPHEQMFAEMARYHEELQKAGVLLDASGLQACGRAGASGTPARNAPWSGGSTTATSIPSRRRRLDESCADVGVLGPLRHRRLAMAAESSSSSPEPASLCWGAWSRSTARRQLAREPLVRSAAPQGRKGADPAHRVPIPAPAAAEAPPSRPTPSRLASSPRPEVSTIRAARSCEKNAEHRAGAITGDLLAAGSARPARSNPALEVGVPVVVYCAAARVLGQLGAPAAGQGFDVTVSRARNARLDASPAALAAGAARARAVPCPRRHRPAGFRPNLHS